jgi:hypothetical protein
VNRELACSFESSKKLFLLVFPNPWELLPPRLSESLGTSSSSSFRVLENFFFLVYSSPWEVILNVFRCKPSVESKK